MAQSREAGDFVTMNNTIAELLAEPLDPEWTVDALAERLLDAIASGSPKETRECVLDEKTATNAQVRRLFRPLLACLAAKSVTESGANGNLYSGQLSFRRTGTHGVVRITGDFENRPGSVRLTLRRSNTEVNDPDARTARSGPSGIQHSRQAVDGDSSSVGAST